ncbi:MAG: cadherin-like beta sandwich domain-containing protein, partial [Planctomycetota bacterium]
DINNKVLTGPVVLTLLDASNTTAPQTPDNTGEVFPIILNANSGSSATNTITIKPATGVVATLSGPASTIIKLNGADYVTIDGSNSGGTDRSLTISTSSATGGPLFIASLGVGAGATNVTIKNCIIKGGSIGTTSNFTYGIFVGDTAGAAAGADNDDLTIQNNQISLCRTGIQAVGAAGGVDDNMMISGNTFGDNVLANSIGRIGMTLSTANNLTVSGNTIKNIFLTADTSLPAGMSLASLTTATVSGNSITGMQANGSVTPIGIIASASTGVTITQNTIDGVVGGFSGTGSGDVFGMALSTGFVNSIVSRNFITNISYNGTGGYGGRGIDINTGSATSALTIRNNAISNIKGDGWSSFASDSIVGIRITGTTGGLNFYYNSVNLGSGSFAGNTSGTLSAAFYCASTVTALDLRDNIFATNLVNSNAAGAKSYAIYSDAPNTAFTSINYNDYFVSGTQGVLGLISATDRTTLAAIQTGFGQNAMSVSGNPQFVSATDLHINPAVATVVESGGTPIAGITVDIDGDTRNVATPDIGADEGTFTPVVVNDVQATAFIDPTNGGGKVAGASFSPQASFTNNGTAAQTNVPVRYRICSDGTCTTELYNQTTTIASLASGATATATFSGTSLSAGSYTIKAKAELGTDTVPANDEITGTFTAEAPLSGGYTVGSGGAYATLTQAVSKLSSLGVTGAVTLTLLDASNTNAPQNTGEVFPITFGAIPGASAVNTVTIRPANGVAAMITNAAATAIFKFNGASYVTIDGVNAGGSNLTIQNANPAANTAAIWVASNGTGLGSTNNTIKNCTIAAGANGATANTFGIFVGGTSISTSGTGADNDNLTIQNNAINTAYYGIYAVGTAAVSTGGLDGLTISGNAIGDSMAAKYVIWRGMVIGGAVGATISQNEVFNLLFPIATSGDPAGIELGSNVANAVVSANKIHDIENFNSGGYAGRGISISSGTGTTGITIANNMIYGMRGSGWSSATIDNPFGIHITGGTNHKVYANSIYLSGAMTNSTGGNASGIIVTSSSATGLDIRDNAIRNSFTGTGTPNKAYALYAVSGTTFGTIDYNDYYSNGTGSVSGFLNFLASDVTSLANWKTATTQDANSISAAPGFVSTSDLHLSSNSSPAANAGTPIAAVTVDIDGHARSATRPDIGADEIASNSLSALALSMGSLTPAFAPATLDYTASVSNSVSSITVTPTVLDSNAIVTVNGNAVTSGSPSGNIPLMVGDNTITVVVSPEFGPFAADQPNVGTTKTYTVVVNRAAATYTVTYDGNNNTGGTAP